MRSRGSRATLRLFLPLQLLLLLEAAARTSAASSSCFLDASQLTRGDLSVSRDCHYTPGVGSVRGVLGLSGGPPALIIAGDGAAATSGAAGADGFVSFTYVLLVGFELPDPRSPAGLVPTGLHSSSNVAAGGGHVSLRDVRILVDSDTLQRHVQFFSQQQTVKTYSDGATFLHVNYVWTPHASWQSVGLLLASDLQDARSTSSVAALTGTRSNPDTDTSAAVAGRPPKYGYVLSASNVTFVPLMQWVGGGDTAAQALMYVDGNMTLSKPSVPEAGMLLLRPLAAVGLSSALTSLDLAMQVNTIIMSSRWSNISFDSLALENMGPGDARSAEVAKPLSVGSANNLWALHYDRQEVRMLARNITMVLGSQTELDYYRYWVTVYQSSLPYFKQLAKFIHDVIRITVWEVSDGKDDNSIRVVKLIAGSCVVEDAVYTVTPVVAPRMSTPELDPRLQLKQGQQSALVTAVSNASALLDQLQPLGPSEEGRDHVILLRDNVSLPAAARSSNGSTADQQEQANGTTQAIPPGGLPVPYPVSLLCDVSSHHSNELDLAFHRGLLALDATAADGQLQVQHLVLRGLAQGPGAAAAPSLDSADVWTILLWAVNRRTAASVALSGSLLELPPQEFQQLQQLAAEGSGQIVLKLAGDARQSGGDGLLVLNGVAFDSSSSSSMRVDSLTGHGLNCSRLVLVASPAAAQIPGGYHWPGGALHSAFPTARGGLAGPLLAAAIAVPLVVLVVASAAVAALLLLRKRPQWQCKPRQQQLDLEKALYNDCLLPSGSGSNCSRCSKRLSVLQDLPNGKEAQLRTGQQYETVSRERSSSHDRSSGFCSGCKDTVVCSYCSVAPTAAAAAAAGAASADAGTKGADAQCKYGMVRRAGSDVAVLESISAVAADQQHGSHPAAAAAAAAVNQDSPGVICKDIEAELLLLQQKQRRQQQQMHQSASGMQADSSGSSSQAEQQLLQHGLQLLRARPVGTLTHSASEAWGGVPGQGGGRAVQGGPSHSSSAAAGSQPLPVNHWQSSAEAAAAMGCCVQPPLEEEWQPPAVTAFGSSSSQQQQRATDALGTQTLFYSAEAASPAAVLQLHPQQQPQLQQQQQQQQTALHGEAAGEHRVVQQQHQDQQQQDAATAAAATLASGATKAAAGAAGAGPLEGAGSAAAAAAAAAPKPWHRVSHAISLLQQGITKRRLEAGLAAAGSQEALPGSGTGTEAGSTLPSAATAGNTAAAASADGDAAGKHAQRQPQQLIAAQLQGAAAADDPLQVQLLDMVGRGSFASVYRAIWRGCCVAVKVVQLPAEAGLDPGREPCSNAALLTRERMAVMEAVVSITMSHPNIVQVFTFALKPLPTLAASQQQQLQQLQQQQGMQQGGACPGGWELQLVMEYCDEGSLRHALNQGRLADPSSSSSLPALHLVLALAHDVACAMLHLHSEHLIHADLKASNVLLTRGTAPMPTAALCNGGGPCVAADCMPPGGVAAVQQQQQQQQEFGAVFVEVDMSCAALMAAEQAAAGGRLIAKVADFGLSLSLDPGDTHVSHMHGGTLTHMAPELLLHGRSSSASDVYAYGILLWELLTARRAFQGVPVALLAPNVVQQRWRPGWPDGVPTPLRLLTEQCWAQEAGARPSFQQIVARLEQLMQLSPDQLHNGGALWTRVTSQQQHQSQPSSAMQAAAAPDAHAPAAAACNALQQQLQQQQQQDGAVPPGLDVTGAWSLPGGAARCHGPTGR